MINTTTLLMSFLTVPIASIVGSKTGHFIAQTAHTPDWLTPLIGPVGALAGMVCAIRWLVTRLDKQEVKADLRETERAVNLRLIAEMNAQNQAIISQNSLMLAEAKCAIEKCVKCEIKHLVTSQNKPNQ